MTTHAICALSIDLDALPCYYQIHGLGEPPRELAHVVLERGLPRASALFARRGVSVTWFVVARDVDGDGATDPAERAARGANADLLRARAAAGDELASHSYSHFYDLARRSDDEVDDEIARADRVLKALAGGSLHGFRAPGYDLSPAMLAALARRGYRYDSSLFPAPAYYAAKAAVMTALAIVRRPSGAVLTDPRGLLAPAEPYRPAMRSPWRRGQAPVVELPIAVTPGLRMPAIGTSLLVAPQPVRRRVLAAMARRPFFNFELHGIDFCDAERDGIPGELVARQLDLRIPIDDKLARLERMLDEVGRSFEFRTLAAVATDVQRDH